MRCLNEDARAVAGVDFATARAAVIHVAEDFLGINENLMAAFAFHVRDKADAARIVLVARIIEALFACRCHP